MVIEIVQNLFYLLLFVPIIVSFLPNVFAIFSNVEQSILKGNKYETIIVIF